MKRTFHNVSTALISLLTRTSGLASVDISSNGLASIGNMIYFGRADDL